MSRLLSMSLILVLGIALGVAGHVVWQSLARGVTASGVLRQELPVPPGASASFPAGYYVESRVYLRTATADLLGRAVTAWGPLGRATDPDAPAHPKVENTDLAVVR